LLSLFGNAYVVNNKKFVKDNPNFKPLVWK